MGLNVGSEVTSEGSGRLVVTLTNLGDAPLDATSIRCRSPMSCPKASPPTASKRSVAPRAGTRPVDAPCDRQVGCTFEDELPSYEAIEVEVLVALEGGPPEAGKAGKVTVAGGDAPKLAPCRQSK